MSCIHLPITQSAEVLARNTSAQYGLATTFNNQSHQLFTRPLFNRSMYPKKLGCLLFTNKALASFDPFIVSSNSTVGARTQKFDFSLVQS
jgi:hypothetical protein